MYSLKIAFRNLKRNGLYSWINVIGLAISLTACALIMLWVQDELSFDKFNEKAKNIYIANAKMNNTYWATTPAPLAIHAKAENPEIEEACRIAGYPTGYFEYENNKYYDLDGKAVDSTFFKLFDFPLLDGKPDFADDLSLIISETKAKVIFGDENPVGKTLKTNDNNMLFRVVGIVKDAPKNSSITFDFLVPFDVQQRTFQGNGDWKLINEDWGNYFYRTFFLLSDKTDKDLVSNKISEQITRLRNDGASQYQFVLQPLLQMHLYNSKGEPQGMKTVRLFTLIALLILIIACINYVNLVTARSVRRSKEIAMRKILGAHKTTLLTQFVKEILLLLLPTFMLTTILIYFLMPAYNQLTSKEMVFSLLDSSIWFVYAIMALSILLLAGLYPAFLLSSFKPIEAFRTQTTGKKQGTFLRKALVVTQFVFSFGLIVATVVISLQLNYMREKDLGYDKENVFTMRSGNMGSHYDAVKNELLKNKDVISVTAADHNQMRIGGSRSGADWPGKPDNLDPVFFQGFIQPNFFETMNIELLAGTPPSIHDTFALFMNEQAIAEMGLDDPVGKPFYLNKGDDYFINIKGVVKNYNFESLNENIKPLFLVTHPAVSQVIYVRTAPNGAKSALETAESLWKQYNPDYEFSYAFLDETFDRMYKEDIRIGQLFTLFSIIAIFTSCLGLFGLVTYTAETKTKEIGIRKVLGASVANIIGMLSKEFLILVGIAMIISIPISYYLLNKLLLDYAYRIAISWWFFGIAALVTIVLTLLSISFKSVKAATANPVKSIKN